MSEGLSVYSKVQDLGFFAYSGADGDLFRKNGLAGWRISLSPYSYRIQKKSEFWEKHGKTQWTTQFKVKSDEQDNFTREQKQAFLDKVEKLVENGELQEQEGDSDE